MKRKIIVSVIFLTASFIYKKASPVWITNWGIDPATYLFISLLPAICIFGISSRTNGLIAIFFLVLMAFTSIFKYEQIAENMAIMAFFFLTLSVFQQIGELIISKKTDE